MENILATKLPENLAFYRILDKSRSSKRLKNIYWLWRINRNYNKLNFFRNITSLFFISLNSCNENNLEKAIENKLEYAITPIPQEMLIKKVLQKNLKNILT